MIQETRPDELGALRARVARLEATRAHPRRRSRFGALVVATFFIALAPLAVLAAPAFGDLDSAGAEHRPEIQAIGGAGIATGFDDPASDDPDARLYDSKGLVTREQMASFLARTAGLGGNPPVANAARATSAAFVTLDATGVNMDVLALTITAPTEGFVLVVATAYGNAMPTNPCPCELQARLTDGMLTSPPVTRRSRAARPTTTKPAWPPPASSRSPPASASSPCAPSATRGRPPSPPARPWRRSSSPSARAASVPSANRRRAAAAWTAREGRGNSRPSRRGARPL